MPEFYFEPVARLQRYLGKELIADPNLAIIEFVKNAYDADASKVLIHFVVNNRPKSEQWINISDNGTGMDVLAFKENWMRPGYSYKAKSVEAIMAEPGVVGRSMQRVPTGEKGLGRLAAGRLGDIIHIYTRTKKDMPWLHVYIDWEQFEPMDKPLNKVPITYEETATRRGSGYPVGTIVLIEGLMVDWSGRLPGRRAPGRSSYRLGRLREDLSILMQPLPRGQHEFNILLSTDSEDLEEYHGSVTPMKSGLLDYEFGVNIYKGEKGIYIERQVKRSPEIANFVGKAKATEKKGYIHELYRQHELESFPDGLSCGPFSGVLYYSPQSSRRLKELSIAPGVFLYRDGMRVEPYGQEGNDWLGAMAWKAARQGYAPVQPSNLTGYFMISRIENPELRDMSNRQGLIDNDAYQAFLAICRNEFRWFGDLVLQEYVQPQWETMEEKAQRAAQRTQTFGIHIIRSIAHSVRQSTAGLGAELSNIEQLLERCTVPREMGKELSNTIIRSWKHLDNIDETISRFLKFDQETLVSTEEKSGEISLKDVLEEAVSQIGVLADSKGVKVQLEQCPPYKVRFNKDILINALTALISNGIEASCSAKTEGGSVTVSVARPSSEHYEILVEDNGTGVDASNIDEVIGKVLESKGRPAVGLFLTRDAIAFAGGKVSLESSSNSGSIFKISIPAKGGF